MHYYYVIILSYKAACFYSKGERERTSSPTLFVTELSLVITVLWRYLLKENTINFKANQMCPTFVSRWEWDWSDNARSHMQFSCLKSQITQRYACESAWREVAALIIWVSLYENRESFMTQILSLIHIWRCRRGSRCRSRWSPYH